MSYSAAPSSEASIAELYASVPIPVGEGGIRVVDLQPGKKGQSIQVELRGISMDDDYEPYEGLSYTWGKSTRGNLICVNSQYRLPVTDNLFAALGRLRKRSKVRTIWIDAICINQADLVERGSQVAQMRRIYQETELVNVWLGDCEVGSRWSWSIFIAPFWVGAGPPSDATHPARQRKVQYWDQSEVMRQAMRYCTPRWQDRLWVIQEFYFASRVKLCFGPLDLTYSQKLARDLRLYAKEFKNDTDVDSLMEYLASISNLRDTEDQEPTSDTFWPYTNWSIPYIMAAVPPVECSDLRDRVYGLLGLLEGGEADWIVPDYTLSIAQVYAHATYACIKAHGTFEVLSLKTVDETENIHGLPSWAFDYSRSDISLRSGSPLRNYVRDLDIAGPICLEAEVDIDSSFTRLSVSAVPLSTITSVVEVPFEREDRRPQPELRSQLENLTREVIRAGQQTIGRMVDDSGTQDHAILHVLAAILCCTSPSVQHAVRILNHHAEDFAIKQIKALPVINYVQRALNGYLGVFRDPKAAWSASSKHSYALWDHAIATGGRAVLYGTADGFIGFAPHGVRPGDQIALVRSPHPFLVLRECAGSVHRFCGVAHVYNSPFSSDSESVEWWTPTFARLLKSLQMRTYHLI